MTRDYLVAHLVFDRSVVPGDDERAVPALLEVLVRQAPAWAGPGTTWSPNPNERRPVDLADPGAAGRTVAEKTRLAAGDRNAGNVELRGATPDLAVVISVNDRPLARVGGRLLLNNSIRIEARRRTVAGRPAADWLRATFGPLCAATTPAWAAGYVEAEYWAKVMTETPSLRAIGRDFASFLPGLFPLNYFGARYAELIGADAFTALAGLATVEQLGPGWSVRIADDPFDWPTDDYRERAERALDVLGREYFFDKDKQDSERTLSAPQW